MGVLQGYSGRAIGGTVTVGGTVTENIWEPLV